MKKIKDYTIEELKALAYDLMVQQEQLRGNLMSINQEIAKRSQLQPKVEKTDKQDKKPE